jgi:hypothetical protein
MEKWRERDRGTEGGIEKEGEERQRGRKREVREREHFI